MQSGAARLLPERVGLELARQVPHDQRAAPTPTPDRTLHQEAIEFVFVQGAVEGRDGQIERPHQVKPATRGGQLLTNTERARRQIDHAGTST